MENIFEIVTIKSLSDNYIWLLRNNLKNLTAVIDPSDDKDVNEVQKDKPSNDMLKKAEE